MAKIAINLNDVAESKPVPAGRYGLTIASAEAMKSQKGADMLKVSIGIDGHDTAPNISHFISFPSGDDDAGKANFKALMCKRFLVAFGIPGDAEGFDTDDFPGSTADLELGLSEPNDTGDVYNRLVLPKLKDEGANVPSTKGRASPPKR